MAKRQTKAEKLVGERITRVYSRACHGIQINVMDMGKVLTFARKKIDEGADDEALGAALHEYTTELSKRA